MTVAELVAILQDALDHKLDPQAPVVLYRPEYGILDLEFHVNPRGKLGPGSILVAEKQPEKLPGDSHLPQMSSEERAQFVKNLYEAYEP